MDNMVDCSCGNKIPIPNEASVDSVICRQCAKKHVIGMNAFKTPKTENSGGFFGPEKAGINKGVMGGVLMMAIAVVWFVVGLYFDILFYYPPILFVIGLYAFFKGLFTGNVAGEKSN